MVLCHCGEGGVVRVVFCGGVDVCGGGGVVMWHGDVLL